MKRSMQPVIISMCIIFDTLEKVPNRGLQMKMGKDGCYQMNSNDDSRNFNILQLTDIHITERKVLIKGYTGD